MRTVVFGGRVVDPKNGRDGLFDVLIVDGRVAAVEAPGGFDGQPDAIRIDATGRLVCPGLIDIHTHVYRYATNYGVEADRAGVRAGVTTVCDMGSSGHYTFRGLRHYVIERSLTDVYAYLMINAVGMPSGGPRCPFLMHPETAETEEVVACIEKNRDRIRGIKCHADPGAVARWGLTSFQRALEAGRRAEVPLYVHTGTLLPMPQDVVFDPDGLLPEVLPRLRPGDVVAHMFGSMPGTVAHQGQVHRAAIEAHQRGVLFDVGYGIHFSFDAAERVLESGIRPFLCSSDIHGDFEDDAHIDYSMVGAMNRLLALGFSLSEVVAMSAPNPAQVLGIDDRAGALTPGLPADLTLLELETGELAVLDSARKRRVARQRLRPALAIKAGRPVEIDRDLPEYRALST